MVRSNAFLRDPGGRRVGPAEPTQIGPPAPTTPPVPAAPAPPKRPAQQPLAQPVEPATPPVVQEPKLPEIPEPAKPEELEIEPATPEAVERYVTTEYDEYADWQKDIEDWPAIRYGAAVVTSDLQEDYNDMNGSGGVDSFWDFGNKLAQILPGGLAGTILDMPDKDQLNDARAALRNAKTVEGVIDFRWNVLNIFELFRWTDNDGTLPYLTQTPQEAPPGLQGSVYGMTVEPNKSYENKTFREFVMAKGFPFDPKQLTPQQRTSLDDLINEMESELDQTRAITATTPTLPQEKSSALAGYEGDTVPALAAPPPGPPGRPIQALHNMTLDEIKTAIIPPEKGSTHTEEEWQELFAEKTPIDKDIQEYIDSITASQALYGETRVAGEKWVADLPDMSTWDFVKFAGSQPMQASLDAMGWYFDNVSKPIASSAIRAMPWVAGGLEDRYHEGKSLGLSDWEASTYAWDEWDINEIYKVGMETPFDPTSWIGMGLLAKAPIIGAKQMGARWSVKGLNVVGQFDYKMTRGFDAATDLMKVGLNKLPKTPMQRALIAEASTKKILKAYLEKHTAGKFVHEISNAPVVKIINGVTKTSSEFGNLMDMAVDAARRANGRMTTPMANVGRILLAHSPITPDDISAWSFKLGGTYKATNEVTAQSLRTFNEMFEEMFWHNLPSKKVATKLLEELGVNPTAESLKEFRGILVRRRREVFDKAKGYGVPGDDPFKVMKTITRGAYQKELAWGDYRFRTATWKREYIRKLFERPESRVMSTYKHTIDKMLVRTFAEAYLTFGMYGPMNVVEDYMRSALGGVMPRRMSSTDFEMFRWGLQTDPDLQGKAFLEMWAEPIRGEMDKSLKDNWFINLMLLPLSAPLMAGKVALGKEFASRPYKLIGGKTYEHLVARWGNFGTAVRRNFVAKRYTQELKRIDPVRYKLLDDLAKGPELTGVLSDDIRDSVVQLTKWATQTGQSDIVRGLTKQITRRTMAKAELEEMLKAYPELPQVARDIVGKHWESGKLFDAMPQTAKDWDDGLKHLKEFEDELNTAILDDFIESSDIAREQYKKLTQEIMDADLDDIGALGSITQQLTEMSRVHGSSPSQILRQVVGKSRGMKLSDRRAYIDEKLSKLNRYLEDSGDNIEQVYNKLLGRVDDLMTDPQQREMYKAYLDSLLSKRVLTNQYHKADALARQEYFRNLKPSQLSLRGADADDLWQTFYAGVDERRLVYDAKNIELQNASEKLARNLRYGAADAPERNPVAVTGRALAPQDVYNLLACEGDDLSRTLLNVLACENDRAYFVGHIMGLLIDGDKGFTPEAVGNVFDQIVRRMKVVSNPADADWLTARQTQVSGLMTDIHNLYTSKMLAGKQKEAVDTYLERVARGLDDLIFTDEADAIYTSTRAAIEAIGVSRPEAEGLIELINARAAALDQTFEEYMNRHGVKFVRGADGVATVKGKDIEKLSTFAEIVFKDSETIITAFRSGEPRDLAHELGHLFMRDLDNDTLKILGDEYTKITERSLFREGWGKHKLDPEAIFKDEYVAKDFAEWWAEGFVKYLRSGSAPTPELTPLFAQFKEWLKHTYDAIIRGSYKGKIPKKARTAYDELFAPTPTMEAKRKAKAINELENWNTTRQTAWDSAEKWYYKEFTDYTHANAFDDAMRNIYPYWTYESQRWQWVPRTFMRRPVTFTTVNRYNDNTDYGNIDIPGIPVDINPVRGTIFGPFTNALVRRDYPNYYDNLPPGMQEAANASDLAQHYGFYPGIHLNGPLSLIAGKSPQTGELLPAGFKTALNTLVAAFPESSAIKFLQNKVFPDRFRDYYIAMEVNRRGMDGGYINDKLKTNRPLTDEEKDVWAEATRRIAIWGVLMEQSAMLRFRPDEKTSAMKAAREAISEMTGISVERQDWYYRHGYNISDQIGGYSVGQQEALQELEYYSNWSGYNGLQPSGQAEVYRDLSLDWHDVEAKGEETKLAIQEEKDRFLAGEHGPDQYLSLRADHYGKLGDYVDTKMEENPYMTPEGMLEFYEKTGKMPPVQHITQQLKAVWFEIKLEYNYDDQGIYGPDWDKFWQERAAVDEAVPPEYKDEWDQFLARNTDEFDRLHRRVSEEYFTKYYDVADLVLTHYNPDEREMIEEYRGLQKLGQVQSQRALQIKAHIDGSGRKLISHYDSEVSQNREALRRANPYLDAWLYYWGKTTSPQTDKTMDIFHHLCDQTGRKWGG